MDSGTRTQPEPPVGAALPGWAARPLPPHRVLEGHWCRVEPLDPPRHADSLDSANRADATGGLWTYMTYGPFASLADYRAQLDSFAALPGRLFHALVRKGDGRAIGTAAYVRMRPETGVIEIGHVVLSPTLRRTSVATEALYLMMAHAFDDLGYRRIEWRSDLMNRDSLRAAERLGFRLEAVCRQDAHYKGRNRDTAWFAVLDRDWPALKATLQLWLAPANFDAEGHHRISLSELTAALPGLPPPRFGAARVEKVDLP